MCNVHYVINWQIVPIYIILQVPHSQYVNIAHHQITNAPLKRKLITNKLMLKQITNTRPFTLKSEDKNTLCKKNCDGGQVAGGHAEFLLLRTHKTITLPGLAAVGAHSCRHIPAEAASSRTRPADIWKPTASRHWSHYNMVLKLYSNSEIGAHVRKNICYLIC